MEQKEKFVEVTNKLFFNISSLYSRSNSAPNMYLEGTEVDSFRLKCFLHMAGSVMIITNSTGKIYLKSSFWKTLWSKIFKTYPNRYFRKRECALNIKEITDFMSDALGLDDNFWKDLYSYFCCDDLKEEQV